MTKKSFEIDGLPNFLRYGASLVCLWRLGAPLKCYCKFSKNSNIDGTLCIHIIVLVVIV